MSHRRTSVSECANPQSSYSIPGLAISQPAVFYGGGAFTARSLTNARVATFYAGFGSTFDSTRGALLVHVDGSQHVVSIDYAHGAVQSFDGTTWESGDSGLDVFFPNIDLSGGTMTTVSVAGGATGTGSVPLAAGTITYMAVIGN